MYKFDNILLLGKDGSIFSVDILHKYRLRNSNREFSDLTLTCSTVCMCDGGTEESSLCFDVSNIFL